MSPEPDGAPQAQGDETKWKDQGASDDADIQRILSQSQDIGMDKLGIDFSHDRAIDQTDKADDAQDFEDISDDDLPDEEPPTATTSFDAQVPGLTDDGGTSHDTDDLFGDGRESSPFDPVLGPLSPPHAPVEPDSAAVAIRPETSFADSHNELTFDSVEDFVKQTWPDFRQGTIPDWNQLLPSRKTFFKEKKPARKPKPLLTTKLSLDIDNDQQKVFRVPGIAVKRTTGRFNDSGNGFVSLRSQTEENGIHGMEFDPDEDSEDELLAGFTLQHINTICYNFDEKIKKAEEYREAQIASQVHQKPGSAEPDEEWDAMFMDEPPKRRSELFLPRMAGGNLGGNGLRRFNISNDEAYELLKEAHQDKVRATIGNIMVDHGLPALRLAWPYYKTRVAERPDQFHRPPFRVRKFVGRSVEFSRRNVLKRKAQKGKARDVFKNTKDLTLRDNSTAVLFEYCERIPTVLSKFGMGNRVINYYRKGADTTSAPPPKKDLGETHILLPEDRSPFAIFGTVDPGETVPTLHNQMFRAPSLSIRREKGGEKGEESLAEKMAPWKTTKAFIDACTGKAMLQLHGEGDPTGHGLGFSFIRTSMKGGYLEQLQHGPQSSAADMMEKQKRDNNGHAYNVKKQEQAYKTGISEIWNKQKTTLSDATLHDDDDIVQIADEDERFNIPGGATPVPTADDSVSQLSGFTSTSRQSKKRLRIVRQVEGLDGSLEERVEIVEDPVVIAQYIKRRNEMDAAEKDILEIIPTGDALVDRQFAKKISAELDRLEKNRDRRLQREQNKKLQDGAGSARSPDAMEKPITGTTRKCANCGQVGHIKTNKKLCPLLNGTAAASGATEASGFGGFGPATPMAANSPPV
ncbi:unnamed protein product [Parascedosporium putredinis]|uniref:Transcription initiation factor TFIID subunit 1 histone acetyltransferase domain-containing protein n=1 Tax=Parascedosporium putredinis TaxID=1442378 RepID=A0A9P1HAT4_9PEZI|nr:unnamed protein product [Parascedosporium putredinis]CAI8002095.1 unnamed protein product [Parascedosporium putredinis]